MNKKKIYRTIGGCHFGRKPKMVNPNTTTSSRTYTTNKMYAMPVLIGSNFYTTRRAKRVKRRKKRRIKNYN